MGGTAPRLSFFTPVLTNANKWPVDVVAWCNWRTMLINQSRYHTAVTPLTNHFGSEKASTRVILQGWNRYPPLELEFSRLRFWLSVWSAYIGNGLANWEIVDGYEYYDSPGTAHVQASPMQTHHITLPWCSIRLFDRIKATIIFTCYMGLLILWPLVLFDVVVEEERGTRQQ